MEMLGTYRQHFRDFNSRQITDVDQFHLEGMYELWKAHPTAINESDPLEFFEAMCRGVNGGDICSDNKTFNIINDKNFFAGIEEKTYMVYLRTFPEFYYAEDVRDIKQGGSVLYKIISDRVEPMFGKILSCDFELTRIPKEEKKEDFDTACFRTLQDWIGYDWECDKYERNAFQVEQEERIAGYMLLEKREVSTWT